jgi:hypothetical protein
VCICGTLGTACPARGQSPSIERSIKLLNVSGPDGSYTAHTYTLTWIQHSGSSMVTHKHTPVNYRDIWMDTLTYEGFKAGGHGGSQV